MNLLVARAIQMVNVCMINARKFATTSRAQLEEVVRFMIGRMKMIFKLPAQEQGK